MNHPIELLTAVLLGLATGVHVSTWGAYKDSPYEGFAPDRFGRSVLVALVSAVVLVLAGLGPPVAALVLFGVVYAAERLLTEYWKLFFRTNDQSGFTIPMRMAHRGKVVESVHVRYVTAATVLAGFVLSALGVLWLQQQGLDLPLVPLILVGGLGGWLTACGGAWKDAPVEGFSGWKFLRSPVVATLWAVPLSGLTDSVVLLVLSAGGFAVASIETYKTFLVRSKAPGKFEGQPIVTDARVVRRALAAVHAAFWVLFAAWAIWLGAGAGREPSWGGSLPYVVAASYAAVAALLVVVQSFVRGQADAIVPEPTVAGRVG